MCKKISSLGEAHLESFFRKCSSCKKEIPFKGKYFLCSVSTCRHPRSGSRFCSIDCWDAHLGIMRHRDAEVLEAKAPSREEYEAELAQEKVSEQTQSSTAKDPGAVNTKEKISSNQASKEVVMNTVPVTENNQNQEEFAVDTLVVVSKVKNFIRERSGMNTSQCCIDALTQKVCRDALQAIEKAKEAGRKTVMGRDIV